MRKIKVKTNYIDKDKLNLVLTEYYFQTKKAKEENLPLPKIPEYVGVCINQICTELGNARNFIRYTKVWKEEMIGDAIVACVNGASKFNPEKPPYRNKKGMLVEPGKNAFNYLSTIAWQAFILRIGKEKRNQYIIHSNFLKNHYRIDETGEEMDSETTELSSRIVEEFEEKIRKKKGK